jgi:hypothetical protein
MKSIVITTIAKPNRCLKSMARNIKGNFKLIIIGDKKSPKVFLLKNALYFSVDAQKKLNFKSDKKLSYNHYSRKNLGYLIAYKNKSEFIYETDDDNLPYKSFYNDSKLRIKCFETEKKKFINIYRYYSNQKIWPRGFPLRFIKDKIKKISLLKKKEIISPIQQYLADGEPDVDAIFRLIFTSKDFLKKSYSLYLPKNSYCPFNSQNTVWHRSVFPLMYLPSTCSFRLTDIYRSYIAQRILWECDNHLSFHPSSVRQIRNSHDLIDDFYHETDSYIKIDKLAYILDDLKLHKGFHNISKNLVLCYAALIKNKFVPKSEMSILKAWIQDIKNIKENN